eukprot:CAMPEP_0185764800 /NCGR_PEP_ID=MMETSP1174-20130828/23766_1 /TAXON_ID=35687 /ORGANISM="Dictyocha speculum, Strain CCMP1381" /LENGTH=95 /DNA_ID=CAMNT_0028447501 /DNA_START=733 /DNA_END=1017 /DNA_ORIENTATION=-
MRGFRSLTPPPFASHPRPTSGWVVGSTTNSSTEVEAGMEAMSSTEAATSSAEMKPSEDRRLSTSSSESSSEITLPGCTAPTEMPCERPSRARDCV